MVKGQVNKTYGRPIADARDLSTGCVEVSHSVDASLIEWVSDMLSPFDMVRVSEYEGANRDV